MNSRKEFYDSLPRKRCAVGVLIWRGDHILIVKPTFRPEWLIPGGIVESFESPVEAALRECQEEIGIHPQITRLLVVDYKRGEAETGDAIHFLFEATINSRSEIKVDGKEISSFAWEPHESASTKLGAHLSKRLAAAIVATQRGSTVFCNNGEIVN